MCAVTSASGSRAKCVSPCRRAYPTLASCSGLRSVATRLTARSRHRATGVRWHKGNARTRSSRTMKNPEWNSWIIKLSRSWRECRPAQPHNHTRSPSPTVGIKQCLQPARPQCVAAKAGPAPCKFSAGCHHNYTRGCGGRGVAQGSAAIKASRHQGEL